MDSDTVKTIENIIGDSRQPTPVQGEGYNPYVALPEHLTLHDLKPFLTRPERVKREIVTHDVDTLNRYWDKWNTEAAEIFADIDNTQIRMVFDEHQVLTDTGIENAPKVDYAQWLDHKAVYNCRKSIEWIEWESNDKNRFSQEEFGEFLEDRMKEIHEPDSANLLALTAHFHVGQDISYSKAVRQADGNVDFAYSQINEASGSIQIPEMFTLGIAPFHNGVVYEIRARFRYRIDAGSLSMWYELIEPHRVIEHAFDEVCAKVKEHTGREVAMVEVGGL